MSIKLLKEPDEKDDRISELEAREAQWLSNSHAMAVRLLGQEQYDNSPCQAHPLELIEGRFRELEVEIDQLTTHIKKVEAWQIKGEELLNSLYSGILFNLGSWWADRPWRIGK